MTAAHELGVSVGAWNALVRRARIGRDRKVAALIVSSYARANGTGIHCGVARVAVDMECSHRTARRYLAWLREVGLIELVKVGNRRRKHSDEYRLILGPNVLEAIEVPDPEHYKAMCKDVGDANHGSPRMSHDDHRPAVTDQGSSLVTPDDADQGSNGARSGVTLGDPPPSLNTSPNRSTSPKTTDDGDLRMDLALVGAPESEAPSVVVEIFPGASQEPPFVTAPPGRRLSRAQQTIAEATAKRAAAVAAHRAHRESS